jgi:hypothetical protein
VNPESKKAKIDRMLIEEATKWVGGLDRIHNARGIVHADHGISDHWHPPPQARAHKAAVDAGGTQTSRPY